jgi:hypothetical protein
MGNYITSNGKEAFMLTVITTAIISTSVITIGEFALLIVSVFPRSRWVAMWRLLMVLYCMSGHLYRLLQWGTPSSRR